MFLLGNSMTEKTNFLGNLCYGTIDDLNGKSKLLILKHKHEIYSGKTSSIHHEIIGLTDKIINYKNNSLDFYNSWDKIFNQSDMIVNLFDSPGDPKFSKTTISNLLNINPEIILIFTNKFASMDKSKCITKYYS
jgi:GTPase